MGELMVKRFSVEPKGWLSRLLSKLGMFNCQVRLWIEKEEKGDIQDRKRGS